MRAFNSIRLWIVAQPFAIVRHVCRDTRLMNLFGQLFEWKKHFLPYEDIRLRPATNLRFFKVSWIYSSGVHEVMSWIYSRVPNVCVATKALSEYLHEDFPIIWCSERDPILALNLKMLSTKCYQSSTACKPPRSKVATDLITFSIEFVLLGSRFLPSLSDTSLSTRNLYLSLS